MFREFLCRPPSAILKVVEQIAKPGNTLKGLFDGIRLIRSKNIAPGAISSHSNQRAAVASHFPNGLRCLQRMALQRRYGALRLDGQILAQRAAEQSCKDDDSNYIHV